MWSEAVESAPWSAGLIIVVGTFAMAGILCFALWRVAVAASASEAQAGRRKRLLGMAAVLTVGLILGILASAGVFGELDGRSVLRVFTIVMAAALAGSFLLGVAFAIWKRLSQRTE